MVGEICGLYLWDDCGGLEFVSTGAFHLMTAIGVTRDEDLLGESDNAAASLLLLAEMGVSQWMDPLRESVLEISGRLQSGERFKACVTTMWFCV